MKLYRIIAATLAIPALLLSILLLSVICRYVHPADAITAPALETVKINLPDRMLQYSNNTASESLSNLVHIKKKYSIDPDVITCPAPNPANFGHSFNPDDVEAAIAAACDVFGDLDIAWNRNMQFKEGVEFSWYLDETIFVLNWAEYYDSISRYCSEIKIADASQFRRTLAGNAYGSSIQMLCSTMADASNAVMASNGDFYIFRNMGINVYRGTLYRCNPGLDTCFIDSDGNLRCFTSDEMNTQEEVEAFVKENGVSFSLSFGPVLVRDGEAFDIGKYPVGEYYAPNIRSVIGQKGDKHYLLMLTGSAMLEMIQERMMQYGCDTVYCLDGGQTGEHRFNGERLNQIMFRGERNVSDIIYFATAMPEDSYWN